LRPFYQMQKISSYLYPNRIICNIDLASSPLEWRIVYQRNIKLYKGLTNDIELDIKNSEQKRLDITGLTLKFKLMDQLDQEIADITVNTATGIKGIARVTIPASTFTYVEPQFLKYTLYRTVSTVNTPLYGDTQFGVGGTIDLLAGAWPTALPPITIKNFLYMDEDGGVAPWPRNFFSEGALIKEPNQTTATTSLAVDFYPNLLNTTVYVQATESNVISTGVTWRDIDSFTVTSVDTVLTKTYTTGTHHTADDVWLRIKYQLPYNSTGKFDKIIVRR